MVLEINQKENNMKIQMEFDNETANRLLSEALDIISEIKETLEDPDLDDREALQQIDYIVRLGISKII